MRSLALAALIVSGIAAQASAGGYGQPYACDHCEQGGDYAPTCCDRPWLGGLWSGYCEEKQPCHCCGMPRSCLFCQIFCNGECDQCNECNECCPAPACSCRPAPCEKRSCGASHARRPCNCGHAHDSHRGQSPDGDRYEAESEEIISEEIIGSDESWSSEEAADAAFTPPEAPLPPVEDADSIDPPPSPEEPADVDADEKELQL